MVQAPDRERSSEVLGELEKCMPALVDENAVRQQHNLKGQKMMTPYPGRLISITVFGTIMK